MNCFTNALSVLALSFVPSTVRAEVVTIGPARDTTIYSSGSNLSNGSGEHLFAGVSLHTSAIRRGLLSFDVAGALPVGAVITSVELRLSMSMTSAAPVVVGLHRALAEWGEAGSDAPGGEGGGAAAAPGDSTWTHRFFPAVPWATPGGEFVLPASASRVVDQAGTYTWTSTPALVADVQTWLDVPASSFGWFLVSGDEVSQPSAKRFDSRENANPTVRPRLTITFTAPACGTVTNYCLALPNSTGLRATMAWSGTTSLAANAFTLQAAPLPPATPYLFIMGTQSALIPFGDGFLCASGTITRLGTVGFATGTGDASLALDFTGGPLAGLLAPGDMRMFQCWFRSIVPGGTGFSLSDGLSVRFCP